MYQFPTKEQLMKKPLYAVRALDIRTKDEENLVQEVVNARLGELPVDPELLNRKRIVTDDKGNPVDIKTKEQEEHYQKLIDEQSERIKPKAIPVIPTETQLEAKVAEIEVKQAEITAAISPQEPKTAPSKAFCEFCSSRGVRHKLDCSRPR